MDQHIEISDVDKVERIRQAVVKLRHEVTVGDVVSETGLSTFEVERGLKELLGTHKGTLRVSESGELLFAFSAGFIWRDHRSWWLRSKDSIYKGFKAFFKIFMMLTLLVYFVIYVMTFALFFLAMTRNSKYPSRSRQIGLGGMIWLFWGNSLRSPAPSYDNKSLELEMLAYKHQRQDFSLTDKPSVPFYTRVYLFVFGPEEAPVDPHADATLLAQLIRSKNGIITADDWILVSSKRRELAEDDLAHYTAVFDGEAEIMDDGTLVYSFAKMMKSKTDHTQALAPPPAWLNLEKRRPLSGNDVGGNRMVISLNFFNLLMSLALVNGYSSSTSALNLITSKHHFHYLLWLGYFPLAFSITLFVIPLLRLRGNIKENNRRRSDNIRRLAMRAIGEQKRHKAVVIASENIHQCVNSDLEAHQMQAATLPELNRVLYELVQDFDGKRQVSTDGRLYYSFDHLFERMLLSEKERQTRDLRKQDLGRIIFSTNEDDAEAEENATVLEFKTFDSRLGKHIQDDAKAEQNAIDFELKALDIDLNSLAKDDAEIAQNVTALKFKSLDIDLNDLAEDDTEAEQNAIAFELKALDKHLSSHTEEH